MLPTIDVPTYEIKIPSTGKPVTVRPFLVKEEKLLLMALQSNDDQEIINTTKQVIRNCIIDGDIDVEKLPFFDVDYLFIALRAKSVGESIDIKFTCNASVNGSKCGNIFPARIDISNSKVVKDDSISNDVVLSGTLRIKMKYPSYSAMKTILDDDAVLNKKIKIVVSSIEYIQDKDKIYSTKDVSKEELTSFVENLTQDQFRKLEHFVDNFPSFVVTTEATCDKCGYNHRLEYRDFSSFFV
jgi:hypothetical protein